ncbi:MAG TPA: amidohydrolase family protein [Acidimicrobiales bacterium]|nr:amidohydrolase family protein [Acidimicrobiales bacterium]
MGKIWANSGDSHFIEPAEAWQSLPSALAERMPRSERDPDGEHETVHVDGRSFRRRLPSIAQQEFHRQSNQSEGVRDLAVRLRDLDEEGIWGELVFPSLGMWNASFRDPLLVREAMKVSNDWVRDTIMRASPRLVPTAQVSMLSIEDAVAEVERSAALGFRAVFLPTTPPGAMEDYNRDVWDPFWRACEVAGMVVAFHIGTDPIDVAAGDEIGVVHRGPGGAVLNHTETTFSGQRAVMKMVASGALDRHPDLKVLVSEGGATWVPFLGDRMNESYRQHSMRVRPKLSMPPKDFLYRQVYASFQHDESAVAAMTAMGYRNVMWGSDYPHMEGTFGHTQETLHHLFDGVSDEVRYRITVGSFLDLFPEVGAPPALAAA